jgi:hypothetical protein
MRSLELPCGISAPCQLHHAMPFMYIPSRVLLFSGYFSSKVSKAFTAGA